MHACTYVPVLYSHFIVHFYESLFLNYLTTKHRIIIPINITYMWIYRGGMGHSLNN
uniref:Uncharacterized protein n=1 Tax=Anguilla anguilla TaxID=7936 RepID=A0A0E9QFI0_ANGAN